MDFETLRWVGGVDGYIEMIDQRLLPGEFEQLKCSTKEQLYDAIKTLAVRGAPAIGVAAGYGICLAMGEVDNNTSLADGLLHLEKSADYLAKSRPTAVNLFWALDRMKKCAQEFASDNTKANIASLKEVLLVQAHAICEEDKRMCKQIGVNGERFIKEGDTVLTHCNAGALATAGQGTALSPMYEAHSKGRGFKVYADETRPLLQGGRLTVWEADRIAANVDAANKIGTFSLSILAKAHGVPFYIAAPSSTFDLSIKSGSDIPIEQREAGEVTSFGGKAVAPVGVKVYNPAFDVTDAANITAIITEKGVIEKLTTEKIAIHLGI